jgi:hypothetical protein
MREYVVGTAFRDMAASRNKESSADEFLEWLNVEGRGMQAFGGVRWLAKPAELPRIIVLLTSESAHLGNLERPWRDVPVPERSALLYWGDARANNSNGKARGNEKLRASWGRVLMNPRADHPLVLYFRREEKGWLTFRGLGYLADLSSRSFLDGNRWVANELAVVTFLPTARVSVEWLRHWSTNVRFRDAPLAPAEYLDWVGDDGDVSSPLTEAEIDDHLAPGAKAAIQQAHGNLEPPPGRQTPEQKKGITTIFVRDPAVRAWVAVRAQGSCELCRAIAPFCNDHGEPFLEVHHVVPLAEGGADTVDNAVALCPNCHRRVHHASDRSQVRQSLEALQAKLTTETLQA